MTSSFMIENEEVVVYSQDIVWKTFCAVYSRKWELEEVQ